MESINATITNEFLVSNASVPQDLHRGVNFYSRDAHMQGLPRTWTQQSRSDAVVRAEQHHTVDAARDFIIIIQMSVDYLALYVTLRR